MSHLPSREQIGKILQVGVRGYQLNDLAIDELKIVAAEWVSGRLVDRETMTPMVVLGGLSQAWYVQTIDDDDADGWLFVDAALGGTDESPK